MLITFINQNLFEQAYYLQGNRKNKTYFLTHKLCYIVDLFYCDYNLIKYNILFYTYTFIRYYYRIKIRLFFN